MAVQDARSPGLEPAPIAAPPRPRGPLVRAFQSVGEWTEFLGRTGRGTAGTAPYFSEVLRQTAILFRSTTGLMFFMNVFQGMTIGTFGFFLLRSLGAGDFFGLITGIITPRQTAVTMFGYVFCSKVCCGITAEIGAMKIQQEIDALESTGVDTMRYIVGTRMAAVLIFTPVACVVGLIAQLIGASLIVVLLLHGVSGAQLLNLNWSVQTINDQFYALLAMLVVAVTTVTTSMFFGLRTSGGPANVGASVAKGIVVNLVLLHVIAAFFAILFYGGATKLPIGG